MRIISGNSKGKKILEPKDLNTRPLKDLTKESIFNILTHSNKFNVLLQNSNVLDLFSGVGNFALPIATSGAKVLAIEGDEMLVDSGNKNAIENNLIESSKFISMIFEVDKSQGTWSRF